VKLAVLLVCALAIPVHAARYALVIGNDTGDREEQALRYAEHDADRFARTLVDLGGFLPGDVVVLRGGDADAARAALIALNDRIRTAGPAEAMLVVYYSGHADAEALHLGATDFALAQLEQLVRGSPAAFRLLVVDACRSGALTRVKGGHAADPFPIALGNTLSADGVVFWTASAASEAAQESDEIKGSLFSHFLVSGLAGPADADGDGTVTTTEAYEYARAATLRASSRTLAGTQHPTFRDELAGRDPIALTHPGTIGVHRAQLRVPDGRDALVLAGSADGPVIAEVGLHDATRQLNVGAGRYFIRERGETHLLEGTVAIAAGDTHTIEDRELASVDYIRVAGKGLGVTAMYEPPRHDAVVVGGLMRSALVAGGGLCVGAVAGYAIDLPWVTVTPRVSGCREHADNAFVASTTDDFTAEAAVGHAWKVFGVELGLQVQTGVAMLHQEFTTTGMAPPRTSTAPLFGGGASIAVPLGRGFRASLDAELDTFVLREADNASASWTPTLGIGSVLAIGWTL
jgi:Caspase domain